MVAIVLVPCLSVTNQVYGYLMVFALLLVVVKIAVVMVVAVEMVIPMRLVTYTYSKLILQS